MELVESFAADSLQYAKEESVFGEVFLTFSNDVLLEVLFAPWQDKPSDELAKSTDFSRYIASILGTKNSDFKFALVRGTKFQQQVWRGLLEIPWAKTRNYSELAQSIHRPKAVRAVASAVGSNPISWFIPCHRVIRKDGSLGGFLWGLELKQKMLESEAGFNLV